MYDPKQQYRCTIIRGKAKKEMDDLLPAYAKIIDEVCPCDETTFINYFNGHLKKYLPIDQQTMKTLANHRTEITGKLFGMYYKSDDGMIYESDRTKKLLNDNDQPAFFKDICYKMQFPNGMDKYQTIEKRMAEGIKLRPNSYVLRVLQISENMQVSVTVKEIGYYVLNSLDVLCGKANPYEVVDFIKNDHKQGIERRIVAFDDKGKPKASSYTYQHIREQMNYLELANLIRISDDGVISLNHREDKVIELFAKMYDKAPEFDLYNTDLSDAEKRKDFQYEWDFYFSQLSNIADSLETKADALLPETGYEQKERKSPAFDLTKFGDEGEELVYEYEKRRVGKYNTRLTNKVIPFGKTKGLGYDLQSIVAEPGEDAEFCKYIEVKSTKRITSPEPESSTWLDSLNITRNEWVAAAQHGEYYAIYRVYFTQSGVYVFVLDNPYQKHKDKEIDVIPTTYRLDFMNSGIDREVMLTDTDKNVKDEILYEKK